MNCVAFVCSEKRSEKRRLIWWEGRMKAREEITKYQSLYTSLSPSKNVNLYVLYNQWNSSILRKSSSNSSIEWIDGTERREFRFSLSLLMTDRREFACKMKCLPFLIPFSFSLSFSQSLSSSFFPTREWADQRKGQEMPFVHIVSLPSLFYSLSFYLFLLFDRQQGMHFRGKEKKNERTVVVCCRKFLRIHFLWSLRKKAKKREREWKKGQTDRTKERMEQIFDPINEVPVCLLCLWLDLKLGGTVCLTYASHTEATHHSLLHHLCWLINVAAYYKEVSLLFFPLHCFLFHLITSWKLAKTENTVFGGLRLHVSTFLPQLLPLATNEGRQKDRERKDATSETRREKIHSWDRVCASIVSKAAFVVNTSAVTAATAVLVTRGESCLPSHLIFFLLSDSNWLRFSDCDSGSRSRSWSSVQQGKTSVGKDLREERCAHNDD